MISISAFIKANFILYFQQVTVKKIYRVEVLTILAHQSNSLLSDLQCFDIFDETFIRFPRYFHMNSSKNEFWKHNCQGNLKFVYFSFTF